VGEEATSDQRLVALIAAKAITVPVAVIERYKLCAAETSDWLGAAAAFLGEEFAEAVGTVRLVLARRKLLTSQDLLAVGAHETVPMERCALVCDPSFVDHPVALGTALGELLLVAGHADELLVARDEPLVADRLLTHAAAETLLVPLLPAELELLHAGPEDVGAAVAARREVVVVAVGAVQTFILGGERLVHQRVLAVAALEAFFVPVLVLVRQVLGVGADGRLAVLARVGEQVLVALDTEGVFVAQDVAVPR